MHSHAERRNDEININITYTIAKEHTQDFIEYIKQIYTYLTKTEQH
ncbi:hypothetical protein [Methylotuvimicrobium sp. KM2]